MLRCANTRCPWKKQIKLLVKRVDSLDKRFDAVDEKFDAIDKKFDAMTSRQEVRRDGPEVRHARDKVETLDRNDTSKFGKIMVRLDETHAVAKLGLEGLEGLRESTDAKFEAAAKTNADQMGCSSRSWSTSGSASTPRPAWRAAPEIMIPCGAWTRSGSSRAC